MTAPKFSVIADDLTGSCDTGVQFLRAGFSTIVVINKDINAHSIDSDTVVFDTETRLLSPKEAYAKVYDTALLCKSSSIIMKKIDSTLRGQIAIELAAAMRATNRKVAIVAPALPQQGRTTVGGKQLINGVPVDQTEFARDPLTPANQSHLPSLFERTELGPGVSVSIEGSSTFDFEEFIRAGQYRWVVVDAENEHQLDRIVFSISDSSAILWVGSAGLAHSLAFKYGIKGKKDKVIEKAENIKGIRAKEKRVLVVNGSMNTISYSQVDYTIKQSGVYPVGIPIDTIVEETNDKFSKSIFDQVRACLLTGLTPVIYIVPENNSDSQFQDPNLPYRVTGFLAELIALIVDNDLVDAMVISGGHTAVEICKKIGAWGIELIKEVEIAIPKGKLLGNTPLSVITKAGGFGKTDSLYRCINALE